MLVVLSLGIGIFATPVYRGFTIAAQQAMDREGYIQAVAPTDEITFAGANHGE